MNLTIAIDGPAGAGKSTISKSIAKKLDILHLDTGAMYRAVGLAVLGNGIDPHDEHSVVNFIDSVDLKVIYEDNKQKTFLGDEDVSNKIRTEEVSQAASAVSKWPAVRKKLVSIQQEISKSMSVVMDGRDIGTYVMPKADYKFYLTASLKQRAIRRHLELKENGHDVSLKEVMDEIKKRDFQDSTREYAPLYKAGDAYEIDTTELGIEEVLVKIYDIIGVN